MNLVFTPRFVHAHRRLGSDARVRADKALRLLMSNPRHPSLRLKKMHSAQDVWEIRVDRDHRMTLRIEKDCYVMRNIGKHDEVLGSP